MSTAGKFDKLERLGEGTYGVVYKAETIGTREVVALKRLNGTPEEEGLSATTIREIALLQKMSHPNVVDMKKWMYEPPKLTLVFEFCEWDLKKYMDSNGGSLDLAAIKWFLRQTLEGLAYCHKENIIHRDLKPQNLLILDNSNLSKREKVLDEAAKTCKIEDLTCKIADFGLARVEDIPVKKFTHEAVTLWYRSPDVILGSTVYNLPVDMWSMGCIFAEMASGVPMFNARTDQDQLARMFRILGTPTKETWPSLNSYPNLRAFKEKLEGPVHPPALDEYARTHNLELLGELGLDLLGKMLRYEPTKRITAAQALRHPFLQEGASMPSDGDDGATASSGLTPETASVASPLLGSSTGSNTNNSSSTQREREGAVAKLKQQTSNARQAQQQEEQQQQQQQASSQAEKRTSNSSSATGSSSNLANGNGNTVVSPTKGESSSGGARKTSTTAAPAVSSGSSSRK